MRKWFLVFLGIALLGYAIHYVWRMAQVLAGFGAKQLCSCVFVSERTEASVLTHELARFPYTLVTYEVNHAGGYTTAKVGPGPSRRAVYRSGLGCVLLTEDNPSNASSNFRLPAIRDTPLPISQTLPGVDYQQLDAALNQSFAEPDAGHLQNTRAVVVLYRDTLVAERYAADITADTRMPGWSMAKSVTNALIGILVRQGKLAVNDPAPVLAWQHDERRQITIDNLLRMQSGLDWNENYFTVSDVTQMLFLAENMSEIATQQPLNEVPGTEWYYSSGTTNILSQIIRETVGEEDHLMFPYRELFGPLGMHSAVWETDLSGTQVGSSYLLATARDWAKFGLLYLKDGVWSGRRILPEGWVDYTTTPVAQAPLRKYGAHFWLNIGEADNPANRRFPDAPTDLFFAEGFDGQNLFIIPSRDLVVVRLGATTYGHFNQNQFLRDLLLTFP